MEQEEDEGEPEGEVPTSQEEEVLQRLFNEAVIACRQVIVISYTLHLSKVLSHK